MKTDKDILDSYHTLLIEGVNKGVISDEVGQRAWANIKAVANKGWHLIPNNNKLSLSITNGFSWAISPEGEAYWDEVYQEVLEHEADAALSGTTTPEPTKEKFSPDGTGLVYRIGSKNQAGSVHVEGKKYFHASTFDSAIVMGRATTGDTTLYAIPVPVEVVKELTKDEVCSLPPKPRPTRYRVWVAAVERVHVDVNAPNEEEAKDLASELWRRSHARANPYCVEALPDLD